MYLSENEKRVLNTSYLLHHGTFTQDIAKQVYRSSLTQTKENYDSKNESTKIVLPYIGTLVIEYVGENEVEDDNKVKKEANIKCTLEPSRELKRTIGDLVDGNLTNIEKKIYKEIKNTLKSFVEL